MNDEPQDVERLNPEGFAALGERAGDGPVVMLNLLAFEPDGGAERYGRYAEATAPLLEGVGGRVVGAYQPGPTLIGGEQWDLVALVEYPTRQAFLDMIASPDYQEIMHLRTDGLVRAALVPMEVATGVPGF
jgi:uncharacterized protein (DUF1330 family)